MADSIKNVIIIGVSSQFLPPPHLLSRIFTAILITITVLISYLRLEATSALPFSRALTSTHILMSPSSVAKALPPNFHLTLRYSKLTKAILKINSTTHSKVKMGSYSYFLPTKLKSKSGSSTSPSRPGWRDWYLVNLEVIPRSKRSLMPCPSFLTRSRS